MSLTSTFKDIADAIREKTGKTETMKPTEMASEIANIQSGGSEPKAPYTITYEDLGVLVKLESVDGNIDDFIPEPLFDFMIFDGWVNENNNVSHTRIPKWKIAEDDNITYAIVDVRERDLKVAFDVLTCSSIDWGDGNTDSTKSHIYNSVGIYLIKIYGVTSINFKGWSAGTDNFVAVFSNVITEFGGNYSFKSCRIARYIYLPNLTKIEGTDMFRQCYSLRYIYAPKVSSISNYAFYECHSLIEAYFPELTTLGTYAFYMCHSLKQIYFPEITTIQSYAFSGCYSLESVFCPKVTVVGDYAFNNCYALKSFYASLVQRIGDRAFYYCKSILVFDFPNLTYAGTSSINACYSLRKAYVPKLTSIGSSSFTECYNLTDFIIDEIEVVPSISTSSSNHPFITSTKITIYVKPDMVDSFKAASGWGTTSTMIIKSTEERVKNNLDEVLKSRYLAKNINIPILP